jgi:hypothetical protein
MEWNGRDDHSRLTPQGASQAAGASGRDFAPAHPVAIEPIQGLTILSVLRAFSSGATAMTGIEAISKCLEGDRR